MADLSQELWKHLENYPDAVAFMKSYETLCHMVDDLIDRDGGHDFMLLTLDSFSQAMDVYSSRFYQQNWYWLYPLCKNLHRVWQRSVIWEKSDLEWKRQVADALRCSGGEMTVAILEHVCHLPQEELRRMDSLIRETAWAIHHDANGEPI